MSFRFSQLFSQDEESKWVIQMGLINLSPDVRPTEKARLKLLTSTT